MCCITDCSHEPSKQRKSSHRDSRVLANAYKTCVHTRRARLHYLGRVRMYVALKT
jgi:hypothetical protein